MEDDLPRPNWIRLGIAVGVGVLIGVTFTATTPDMRILAAALKPWFADHPDLPD